ncbi:hypothetical protein EJB05_24863 [Eragrostis curvula]|uniref:Uncharacterized protein n=1 Tax=Eragrostis curvula TaxID=38414 RepID=A0A5J9VBP1_9POAL|nr:hypothetical protein EJB05_24863 [Eragrostis curvula]
MPLSVTQVGLLRSLHFLLTDRHHSHHKGLNVSLPCSSAHHSHHKLSLRRASEICEKKAIKRKMQATADDQGRITRMKTKHGREILSNQANLLSFIGISLSKLGKLGGCLERAGRPPTELDEIISICDRHLTNLVQTLNSCREHVSEFQSMLVEIKTAASVGKDAAAEEEDAERKEKYAAADAAEDNDPAAEEKDADADVAEDTDPAAEEKDGAADAAEDNDLATEEKDADTDAAKDNDPTAEEKVADANAAEENDPADAAVAAATEDIWILADSAMNDLRRSDVGGRCVRLYGRAFPSVNTTGDYLGSSLPYSQEYPVSE